MRDQKDDLRDCPTAYECRDRLPELAGWMSDDDLKQVRIWKGRRFDKGHSYFDLDNPERGPFVATGEEAFPTDHTYACRDEVPEQVWAKLITWRQNVSRDQAAALDLHVRELGIGRERSAAGDARPLPPD